VPCGVENPIQRVQPHRSLQLHLAQHRLQALRHISKVRSVVVQFRRRSLAEILHQQEINLVAGRIRSRGLRQKVQQERNQPVSVHQRTGLQKLPQLVYLDAVVHVLQPLLRLFYRLAIRRIHRLI
jgi:hypothetical protein